MSCCWRASLLLLARLAAANLFHDLPLHGFELPERSRRADEPGFNIGKIARATSGPCLASVGANAILAEAECEADDGQLWVYSEASKQLKLASDVSLCLDVFGAHAGNTLGTYYCHGARQPPALSATRAAHLVHCRDGTRPHSRKRSRFHTRRRDQPAVPPAGADRPLCGASLLRAAQQIL
eukprot:5990894-Prymnesium_polylepis.1